MSASDFSQTVADFLQPSIGQGHLSGAVVLIADRREVRSVLALGFADIAAGRPMARDTLFWTASQNKAITGTAMMMLVDEGKAALDDPVSAYLPEFQTQWVAVEQDDRHILLKPPSRPITVRDIMSHTSGMRHFNIAEHPSRDGLPLRTAVRTYAMMSLQCEPGTAYNYSNAGSNTVGRIIEVVSGMAYEDFLDARLLRPLGMIDTTFWPSEAQLTQLAKTYRRNSETGKLEEMLLTHQLRYPLSDRTRHPMPAGGLFSTVDDIGRFCQMLASGGQWDGVRYLSPGALAEMTRRQTPPGVPQSYGLSWDVGDDFFGHGGGAGTLMTVFPRSGVVMSFMTSQEALHEDVHKARWELAFSAVARFGIRTEGNPRGAGG